MWKRTKWIYVAMFFVIGMILGAGGKMLYDLTMTKSFIGAEEVRELSTDTISDGLDQDTATNDEAESKEENEETLEEKTEIAGNGATADFYSYRGYELLEREDLHSAVENFEISLQYRKDTEIMYKLADIYCGFQITEGDGCWFMWNFDRAQDLYTEVFCMTGDSAPMVSFCKMCDEVILDSIFRDGYKMQILEYYGVEVRFEIDEKLQPGEYRYYPDFNQEGGVLLIEGKDIEDHYLGDS